MQRMSEAEEIEDNVIETAPIEGEAIENEAEHEVPSELENSEFVEEASEEGEAPTEEKKPHHKLLRRMNQAKALLS